LASLCDIRANEYFTKTAKEIMIREKIRYDYLPRINAQIAQLNCEISAFMKQLDKMLEEHENEWTIFIGGEPRGFWDSEREAWNNFSETERKSGGLLRQVSRDYLKSREWGRATRTHTSI